MRRFATIALSLSLLLGLTATTRMFAQDAKDDSKSAQKKDEAAKPDGKTVVTKDEVKKDEVKKDDATKPDARKDETKKDEAKKDEAPPAPPLPPIPPDVEAKLEAARRAVAEAIVAAQDAGLVQTTIDPPPILDILVTGRATDEQDLKARKGVSPEVFGAWFTGYGKDQKIDPRTDVRITQPVAGLKELFDQRSNLLSKHIKAVRDAKGGGAAEKKAEPAKKAEEPAKKAEEPAKKAEEPAKK